MYNTIYDFNRCKMSKKFIQDTIREIIDNCWVDGVYFDDYFYPDNNIDKKDYEEGIKNNEFIEEKNYRLNIVNKMINGDNRDWNWATIIRYISTIPRAIIKTTCPIASAVASFSPS